MITPLMDFQVHQQRCAGPPRIVNRHVADAGLIASSSKTPAEGLRVRRSTRVPWLPVNTRWTAQSGDAGSRLRAAVRAEITSPNSGTPDNPAGVA